MKGEDAKLMIVAILAVVAIVLASYSIAVPDDHKDEDGEVEEETNLPPTAEINVESTFVEEEETIYFNGSASTDSDGIIIEYTWDFGDGLKDSGMYSNHVYNTVGTYTVVLTVIDDKGDTDTDSQAITVTESVGGAGNQLPVAVITKVETTVKEDNYIYFNGSGSSDEDGIIIEYTWDFGDSVMDSGMYSNHIYKEEGLFNVTLTVIDDDGGTDTAMIAIKVISDPKAALYFTESSEGEFRGTVYDISEAVNLTEISMTIFDISKNASTTQDPISPDTALVIQEGMVCTFDDDNSNEKLDWWDVIYVEYGGTGDTLILTYKHTGSTIAEYSFISVPTPPTGALDFTESTQTMGLYTGSFVSLSKSVNINDTMVTITDDSLGNSETRNLTPGVTIQIPGGMNFTYYDNNQNWKMDGGDTIRVYNAAIGDIVKFTYIPTMSTIAQYTFV